VRTGRICQGERGQSRSFKKDPEPEYPSFYTILHIFVEGFHGRGR
jgi:hypothetical protein